MRSTLSLALPTILLGFCLCPMASPAGTHPAYEEDEESADLYPLKRHESVQHFYSLKGDTTPEALRKALMDVSADLADGPKSTGSRTGRSFIAVSAPADLESRKLERAIAKARVKVQALAVFQFEGRTEGDGELPSFGTGYTTRDFMLGMSSDILWYESAGPRTQFYCVPKKITSKKIMDRYEDLYQPFGGGLLGAVVEDSFTWAMPAALEAKDKRAVEKAVSKLDGVTAAKFDEAGGLLEVTVELAGLRSSLPGLPFVETDANGKPLGDPEEAPTRARLDTNQIYDLLAKRGVQFDE